MATKLQMMQMKAFRKLKCLLMATLLFGGTLQAHVYWDPVNGDDSKSGATYANRVKTFAKAKEKVIAQIASGSNNGKPWIFLCSTCTVSGNTNWDGDTGSSEWNVHIKRLTTSHAFKGRMVTIAAGKKLTLQNIEFDGRGNDTGAPYINDCGSIIGLNKGATLTINEGTILGHNHRMPASGSSTTYNGGAVESAVGAHVIMNGGRITDCQTNRYGGGIYLGSTEATSSSTTSTFIMNDGEIDHCETYIYGGGIYLSGRRVASGSSYVYYYSTATITKGLIHHNVVSSPVYDDNYGRGGGICCQVTRLTVKPENDEDFKIYRNHAKRYGGAFHFAINSSMTITKGIIANNTTGEEGNGIPVGSQGTFAGDGAAGIHITGGSTLNMTGGKLYGNKSQCGAAIHASYEGTLEIMGGEIYNNVAYYQGGAINVHTNTNLSFPKGSTVHIHHNKAGRGGAICIDGANLTIVEADIHDNIAADTLEYLLTIPEIPEEVAISLGNGGAICELMQHLGGNDYMVPANFYMYGGQLYNNKAINNGGAVFSLRNTMWPMVTNPEVTIKGGEIHDNEASNGSGGAIFADDGTTYLMTADTIMEGGVISEITTGSIYNNTAGQSGGGIYMTNTLFTMLAGSFDNNSAVVNGGGFCIAGDASEVYVKGGEIVNNTASGKGGGFAVVGGDVEISEANSGYPTSVSNNTALQGGGLYVSDGSVTVSDSDIIGNNTTAGHGGAFLIDNGSLTVSHTNITGNKAHNGNGGGAYVGNGNIVFNAGTTVTGNTAKNGGGICVDGGVIRYNDGIITGNKATGNGGGIYVNAGSLSDTIFFRGGLVSNDTAVNGGGIYVNAGTLDFGSGTFSHNYASGNGGGIYVKPGAQVLLSGNAIVTKNHVPFANGENVGHGGGIYLAGQVKVGRNAGDAQGTHTLKVEDNYQDTEANLNNIYLPTNDNVIELLSDVRNSATKLGFSVNNGFRKVVYHNGDSSDQDDSWLHGLLTEGGSQGLTGVIFDDSRKYMAVHVLTSDQTFDHNYIYLWGCWISAVDKDPNTHTDEFPLPPGTTSHYTIDGNDIWHIYTKEGLAWFSSYVNGLNAYSTDYNENVNGAAKAVMEADVDMSEYLWVPLGSAASFNPASTDPTSAIFTDGHKFSGEFDGQGHTIRGLDCRYINSIHNYGLFGNVVGAAKITNTFVDGFQYNCNDEDGTPIAYVMGGIAGRAGGTTVISNCEARGVMTSPVAETSIMGGIVGVLHTGGTVHSCIGIPTILDDGLYKGGLVGQTESGTFVMNSFANTSIPVVALGTIGGLVGCNAGTTENCYAHLQGDDPASDTHFGWLVGTNATDGQVNYCYSPVNGNYFYGTNNGTLKGCGYYADNTRVPYLYARRDNQVTVCTDATVNNGGTTNTHIPSGTPHPGCVDIDKQMLICLNNWVTAKNSETGTHPTYAEWQRPTTKVLNDDLPLLLMTGFDAVAATTGDAFIAYGQVNTLLNSYKNATQAVWLYRNKNGLAGNGSSSAKFYIAEGVSVIPSGTVNAYVGVTLDNSAGANGANATFGDETDYTDWHMFSSPLVAAPLGINYVKTDGTTPDNTQWGDQFEYGHPSGMPYYLHTGEGYFPTHRYGTSLPANNGDPTAAGNEGNYYKEWDFYTYYEPEYHWINFKRNSNSHWHQNEPTVPIDYTHYDSQAATTVAGNETVLTRGRGYLLATREETSLQCHGQLTEGQVTIPVTVDGAYSPGYNFLGNPYLSYLDFDDFVTLIPGNAALFGSGVAGYAIIDEDPVDGETPEHAMERGGYKYYAYNSSENTYGATRYIAPHQGFMILAANAGTATFTNDMRELDGDGGHFRGEERPSYALVNLLAYDGNGNRDITTVELGRPDKGGAPLMRELKMATCHVYSHYDDEDWAIAFTQPGISEVPIRFEAYADGEYTMRWNTQNGEFHYLHLIDNLTGADIDCLATDEYRFASTTMDYKSRFRLVFGYTGIEEPEGDGPSTGSGTFAYQSGDELVVTGEGTVELFDVTGRRMSAERIEGVQGTMSVSGLTPGVYLLRLNTATGTRVQKIVINQ